MGNEFLSAYIALSEGEKDPRNLLLAFSIARVLLIEFDVAKYVEVITFCSWVRSFAETSQDLFDITFCYFPIMFRPPPDDPYGITAEDLKSKLRWETLSSSNPL